MYDGQEQKHMYACLDHLFEINTNCNQILQSVNVDNPIGTMPQARPIARATIIVAGQWDGWGPARLYVNVCEGDIPTFPLGLSM
jgi:hypothetical protein